MVSNPSQQQTAFTLNGKSVSVEGWQGQRLSGVLRETLGARDVKIGCDAGDCGACTVLLNGQPVCSCLMPVQQAAGQDVETLTGLLAHDPNAQSLAISFQNAGAAQCGICTPGMMVSAVALLRETPEPNEQEVKDGLGGVLCRCTGYLKIIEAVQNAERSQILSADTQNGEVGTSINRLDGNAKVEGHEQFGDDVAPSGTKEILLIRSPFARAQFQLGDLETFAADHPWVTTILTANDVPGLNRFGVIPGFIDQPVFAEQETRFRGEAVAAIVAAPDALAEFDPERFPVQWQELPSVADVDAAMNVDAPLLHAEREGNLMCGGFVKKGDAIAGLNRAAVTAEGLFETGFVEHAYIEPEAGFAELKDGRVEVHACTQAPVMDLESLAEILALPRSEVRILPTAAGGGFGSKLDLSVQPYLALAALKTGSPVRLAYSRTESMQSTTKRHPAKMNVRIGATSDGLISGFHFEGLFNTGAYSSWGPTVANRVPVHASGPYKIGDYLADAKGIHTHCPPSGAFRGFGVPQAAIAQEVLFDTLAAKTGLDPLEFRLRNVLQNGDETVCGQVFQQGVGIRACFEALRSEWVAENANAEELNTNAASTGSPMRRGVGIAGGWYGCGNTSLPNPSTIKAGILRNGTLVLHQGAMDIGQGANTVIAQIFATAVGVPVSEISLIGGDTDVTPDAGKTSASRQTYVSGKAAELSGLALRSAILKRVNMADTARIILYDGAIRVADNEDDFRLSLSDLPTDDEGYVFRSEETYDPPTRPLDENGQGEPYAQFGYAAHLAVVEVDTELGTIRPLRFVAAHDVGKAINPMLVEGQVHGGIAQGLGMALMEEYIPGATENLHDYLIPTIGDMPPVDTVIVEEPDAHGPYGAKGLGEHVLIPTAPAILNAANRACGIRLQQVPATPSRVLNALKECAS